MPTPQPKVQSHLGTDFTPRFPALGFVSARYGSQFTEFSIPVAGSHGSGHLYSVANAIHGVWEFSRLTFVSDDGRFSLDLAPVSGMQNLPAVSAQTVFLLPIGLDSSQPLSWTLPYYKSKFGIEVQILPAIPMQPGLVDSHRHQVDSEKFIDFAIKNYPEIAQDPSAILIGVTSQDMFIRSFGWNYAFNFRHDADLPSCLRAFASVSFFRSPESRMAAFASAKDADQEYRHAVLRAAHE